MVASRTVMLRGGAAIAALALALAPAGSPGAQLHKKRAPAPIKGLSIASGSIGSFTPAAADPRFGASFGRGGLTASGFRFTPSLAPGNSRRVTVAVRARAATPEQAERFAINGSPLTAYAYNLGVSVGWKRFAITSDYAKVDLGVVPGSREAADVALSYAGRRWSTRLALGADRPLGDVQQQHLLDGERGVSVDLGGSYSITNRLDVTGGVRYKMQHDTAQFTTDDRRDSQAVYVGTAFRF